MTKETTDKYIDKVVKRYAKLFGLPTKRKLTLYLAALSVHGSILSILLFNFSLETFVVGLCFGITFFVFTLVSDVAISQTIMKNDLLFDFRRCYALSFFSSLVWFGILLLGGLVSWAFGAPNLWIRFYFLGFSGALILRMLVLSVVSFSGFGGTLFSSLLQPVLVSVPLLLIGSTVGYVLDFQVLGFALTAVFVSLLAVYIFKYSMDRVGTGALGIASSVLFKAFLANWAEDLITPMETFFEQLGYEQDVNISMLSFSGDKKIKSAFVVPALHPGPFKNLGSSLLPSMIQANLQNKCNCVVSVPHGLVGHELDVATQAHNQRVVQKILDIVEGDSVTNSKASPLVRTEIGDAKASCQIFGDCAFLTLTMAPKTMEDLPQELNSYLEAEAKKLGLSVLAIDAHNSMGGPFDVDAAVSSFKVASVDCLKKAAKQKLSSFKVGAATVVTQDFTVRDGMGPGGISVMVVEVGEQKMAYVTIDGNNMVSGLRQKILETIKELGIDDGEVLTTDTHCVCGMIRSQRGYNLVGEAIDHDKLISYIRQVTTQALGNLEVSEVSWQTDMIPNVKIIGEQQITELTVLADETTERVKRVAVTLFPLASVCLVALLLFIL